MNRAPVYYQTDDLIKKQKLYDAIRHGFVREIIVGNSLMYQITDKGITIWAIELGLA